MRTQHNVKSTGSAFTRTIEAIEPEMLCFRALPAVQHTFTRQQVLADIGAFLEATKLVAESTKAVPVFHVHRPEVCLDFCIHGVLGERISS